MKKGKIGFIGMHISNKERPMLIEMANEVLKPHELDAKWLSKNSEDLIIGGEIVNWFEFTMAYLVGGIQAYVLDDDKLVWRDQYGCMGEGKWTMYSHFLYCFPKRNYGCIEWLYKEFTTLDPSVNRLKLHVK